MTTRHAATGVDGPPTFGLIVGVLLAVAVLVGAWLLLTDGIGRHSIRVNDHTDDSAPTVDLRASSHPAVA